MVEHLLAKQEVVGSSPIHRSLAEPDGIRSQTVNLVIRGFESRQPPHFKKGSI